MFDSPNLGNSKVRYSVTDRVRVRDYCTCGLSNLRTIDTQSWLLWWSAKDRGVQGHSEYWWIFTYLFPSPWYSVWHKWKYNISSQLQTDDV